MVFVILVIFTMVTVPSGVCYLLVIFTMVTVPSGVCCTGYIYHGYGA